MDTQILGLKQIAWIENKFGHCKPLIKDNARIIETVDRKLLNAQNDILNKEITNAHHRLNQIPFSPFRGH
jgi:hypothetical protein